MNKRKVFIISDCTDVAVNEIRLSIYQFAQFHNDFEIEPSITVLPFNLIHCSFQLRLIADLVPENSIIYVVCNPIKTQPERIIGTTQKSNITFIGRNTGVFEWLVRDFGVKSLYEILNSDFVPFGGKFVYPQIIGYLLSNQSIEGLVRPMEISKINSLQIDKFQVLHIDNFGLIKINLHHSYFEENRIELNTFLNIEVNNQNFTAIYTDRLMNQETGSWTIYKGSSLSGLVEIGKVRENGCQYININIGDIIKIKPK